VYKYDEVVSMNWDAVGAIAEMIGGIAVLVTLVYLAVQASTSTSIRRWWTTLIHRLKVNKLVP
jgi:hypothetical protein